MFKFFLFQNYELYQLSKVNHFFNSFSQGTLVNRLLTSKLAIKLELNLSTSLANGSEL